MASKNPDASGITLSNELSNLLVSNPVSPILLSILDLATMALFRSVHGMLTTVYLHLTQKKA